MKIKKSFLILNKQERVSPTARPFLGLHFKVFNHFSPNISRTWQHKTGEDQKNLNLSIIEINTYYEILAFCLLFFKWCRHNTKHLETTEKSLSFKECGLPSLMYNNSTAATSNVVAGGLRAWVLEHPALEFAPPFSIKPRKFYVFSPKNAMKK